MASNDCKVYFYLYELDGKPYSKEIIKTFKEWAKLGPDEYDNAIDSCDIKALGGDPIDQFSNDFIGFYHHYKDLQRGTSSRIEPTRTPSEPEPEEEEPVLPLRPATTTRTTATRSDTTESEFDFEDDEDNFDIEGVPDDEPPPPPQTDFDETKIFLKREVVAAPNFTTFDFSEATLVDLLIDSNANLIPQELRTPLLNEQITALGRSYQKAVVLNNGRVIVAVRPQTFYTRLPDNTHVVTPGVRPIANFGIPAATCTYLILTKTPSEFYRLDFNLTLSGGHPTAYQAQLEKFGKEGSLYILSVDLMPLFTNPALLFSSPQKIEFQLHLSKQEDTPGPSTVVSRLLDEYSKIWSKTPPTVKIYDMSQTDYEDLLQNPFIPQFIKDAIDTNVLETPPPVPEPSPTSSSLTVQDDNMILLNPPISFDSDSKVISSDHYAALNELVGYLNSNLEVNLRIEGHTDSHENGYDDSKETDPANDEANALLSLERAEAIKSYLSAKGINQDRLTIIGHGETIPTDTNNTDAGRAANRRVEFVIVSSPSP